MQFFTTVINILMCPDYSTAIPTSYYMADSETQQPNYIIASHLQYLTGGDCSMAAIF